MNGVFPVVPKPEPWTPGPARRPAIVVGNVKKGQAAVFADDTGRTLEPGDPVPAAHKHKQSDVTGLADALAGKQDQMVVLDYGTSTWADFEAAYAKHAIVYCRKSTNTGVYRMAFLAFVSGNEAEFQYYRSVGTHDDTQQGDQIIIYKLRKTGNAWSETTREAVLRVTTGSGIAKSVTQESGAGSIQLSLDTRSFDDAPTANSNNPVKSSGIKTALDAKANANEMAVTAGTGSDADKTTIQLKSGTSATVLRSHQDISFKANKASGAVSGHLASLDSAGNLQDSGGTLRYAIVTPSTTTSSDTSVNPTDYIRSVSLTDRATNLVTQGTDGNSHPITQVSLTMPSVDDNTKVRDFAMVLFCDQTVAPSLSLASYLTIYMSGSDNFAPEVGTNIYFFREFEHNKYVVARKKIVEKIANLPDTAEKLAALAGIPAANSFSEIQQMFGLADSATVQHAVDAAMQL